AGDADGSGVLSLSSQQRPRQPCVMRPCRSTWVASTITNAAPECAIMPRCITRQCLEQPPSPEYWHMGETTMRLASSRPARRNGVNKLLDMMVILARWGEIAPNLRVL